ncbi:MAG: DUF1801 domain-containing protein [Rhodospirillaceae bacterium]|nr:DUF1801 domain-containing protein [Rhodospirillaceae bacterium]MBT5244336.1 DUF1801 domain-containing protein [Rhodospirillaceae bacterium]MBT5563697.1 DUF1801 domain-containing protein [Rhodospirillaceae bacterium]MBT6241527.1 DUF1801 domain-containing protein [Rhodospirillaceae bacterium]MBT7137057.1 DUF1801 domain-containing protein [Rhodospirillaceae bacterium]
MGKPFENIDVTEVFAGYSEPVRAALMVLRALIFETASKEGVGRIEETLKWGQPSYLTPETKSGTTIRIHGDNKYDGDFALYVNCQSSLVEEWRQIYPTLTFGGNRSIHFSLTGEFPIDAARHCISMALKYHSRKNG